MTTLHVEAEGTARTVYPQIVASLIAAAERQAPELG